ncbi:PREDICTED: androgen-induced gene 1 protein isoform X1 [Rhagoletis zephyria]|uniref:androgen-induced gene 1 protein isoform X1 n=1 Tax=Rhagoletis zephyria TaxID=28612 RepID=UPI0008116137|nr:PREDICTED: androgen-induced gene 1 protein isoform X1 [Rhagoletis zephyria]
MTKSKKKLKEQQQVKVQNAIVEERLTTTNDAYTQGAFSYLRMLTHIIGLLQFTYGIYYHWFNVHWPQRLPEEEELKTRWGGKFKYLTFLDMILQALYHFVALLNDLVGSNEVGQTRLMPGVRKLRDYIFATWAFPIAHNFCISFWVIYAYDRELIFPKALDAIFPNWLNHIVHTNVAMLAILDMFTCFRQYPSRTAGLTGTIIFMVLYIIWMHIVRFFSGHWVYPLLEIINLPMRYLMLSALLGFTVFCYFLGEFLNKIIWSPELRLLRMKSAKIE